MRKSGLHMEGLYYWLQQQDDNDVSKCETTQCT